jgi:ketosteroid isomerase-like protein
MRAFAAGDLESSLDNFSEDVELWALRSATEGAFRGHEGLRAFLSDNRESFDVFEPQDYEIEDLGGGRLLGIGSIRVRGKGSGVEAEVPSAFIVTVKEGKIVHVHDYGDKDAARKAAGLD